MEAIKLPLPAERTDSLRIVHVWGERRLQGFADTGVFSISTGSRQIAAEPAQADRYADDGLADTTIEFDGRLSFAGHDSGNDPYNRSGTSSRKHSL